MARKKKSRRRFGAADMPSAGELARIAVVDAVQASRAAVNYARSRRCRQALGRLFEAVEFVGTAKALGSGNAGKAGRIHSLAKSAFMRTCLKR